MTEEVCSLIVRTFGVGSSPDATMQIVITSIAEKTVRAIPSLSIPVRVDVHGVNLDVLEARSFEIHAHAHRSIHRRQSILPAPLDRLPQTRLAQRNAILC